MNPCGMNSFDLYYMAATFTLTNVVPQYEISNQAWAHYEDKLMKYARNTCGPRGGTLFVLAGSSIIKGEYQGFMASVPPQKGGVQVAIPTFVWMAACCSWTDSMGKKSAESLTATIGNYNDVSKLGGKVITLGFLELQLTVVGKPTVNLFPGDNCRKKSKLDWAK